MECAEYATQRDGPVPRGVSEESTPERSSAAPRGALELFRAVERLLAAPTPPAVRATKSQVAFREQRGFAYLWWPGRYVDSECPRRAVDRAPAAD